jgi:hypothetical protein
MNYHPSDTPKGHSPTQCPTGAEKESALLLPARNAHECVVVLKCYDVHSPMC